MGSLPALGLNGTTTGPRVDLLADIRLAGEAGFDFVELRDDKLEAYLGAGGSLAAARRALAEAGVRCASLNALEDATLAEGAAWEARLERWRTLCRWAEGLGCDLVVAVPSRRPPGMAAAEVEVRTRRALAALAAAARPHGVRAGFEFLGFAWCSVNTLADAATIVGSLATAAVGLVVDTFHCHVAGVEPAALARLDPRRLFLVHLDDVVDRPQGELADADRVLPGEGVMPLAAMLGGVAAAGYRGGYSVELFRPEYWAGDPRALVRRAHAAARRVLAAVGAGGDG